MALVTNFDALKELHAEALRCGTGSRPWIEFASTMADSFPSLYKTAQLMNVRMRELEQQITEIRKELP